MRKFKLFPLAILIVSSLSAQVKTKTFYEGLPSELKAEKNPGIAPFVVNEPAEFEALKKSAEAGDVGTGKDYTSHFAIPVETDIDVLKTATVTETKETITYRLPIQARSALNISLNFGEFALSPGAVLSLNTDDEITDSITAQENTKNKVWNSRVYHGELLNLVLIIPTNERDLTALKVTLVYFGYAPFGGDYFGSPGASGACNINTACPTGNGWNNERNSVGIINAGGQFASGALIMNGCGVNIPYFLTANHVLNAGDPTNWTFEFFFFSTACATNTGYREDVIFNGCTVRANSGTSDFALFELRQTPAPALGLYYSGWNRDGAAGLGGYTTLHHPQGDVMKVSHTTGTLTAVPYVTGPPNYWRVTFTEGIVQPGSSGAPLYDVNHKIVGQCRGYQFNQCGSNSCYCNQPQGEFGRFDISWAGDGTNSTRLSNWLDPANFGGNTRSTTSAASLVQINGMSIAGAGNFCSGSSTYTINNLPAGATVVWSHTLQSGAITRSCSNCTSTTLTKGAGSAAITLTATVTYCVYTRVLTSTISAGSPPPTITLNLTCPEGIATAHIWGNYGGVPYTWHLIDAVTHADVVNSGYGAVINYHNLIGTHNIGVTYTGNCGTSDPGAIYNVYCPGGGGHRFAMSPNPTSSSLNISIDSDNETAKSGSYSFDKVSIFDTQGNLKLTKSVSTARQASLNVSNLMPGNYYVEIKSGDYTETQQLIIQK